MRFKAMSKALVLLLIFFVLFNTFTPIAIAQNSPPALSKGTVTPRIGRPNIEYLFTVTYTDIDNDTPLSVKVFIDLVDYEMEEVDPTDVNYTDGKEYFFEKVMEEGTYTIYYSADDGNDNIVKTNSFTLSVTWDVGHYDIIHFIEEKVFPGLMLGLAMFFVIVLALCIISIFMVLQLRKIAKELVGEGEGAKEGEEAKMLEDDTEEDVKDETKTQ